MKLCNLENLPGHAIVQEFGVVSGSTVRSKHVGKDLFAGLKNLVGGELTAYTELLSDSRQQAMSRMVAEATSLGANAVLGVRFSTSSIAQGAAELYVYGTAVLVEPRVQSEQQPGGLERTAAASLNSDSTAPARSRLPDPFA